MTEKNCREEIIFAGFGGQGVILLGKLMATAAMKAGYEVTYIPSYGAEVRGGTANCSVIIDNEPIASPLVTEPDTLIVMNQASFDKFVPKIKPRGLLVMNTSLIETPPDRDDIEVMGVAADEIAHQLKSPRSANMIALGVYLKKRGLLTPQQVAESLPYVLAKRHHDMLDVNTRALMHGG
ncbi:MAG: 2-oxoacid:ferredoxin oxidoreductase subunit gamma [Phycisphaerae bacterium SM23_30]|nr:MAG: 2-oxoacid:ferredoxin oxidoreductase subunit gamma [Phycisphaerae bacterium SM23_30]